MLPLPALLMLQAPLPSPPPARSPQAEKPDPIPPAKIELTTPFPVHLGSIGPREAREAVFGIKSIHDRPFHLRLLDLSPGLRLDEAQFKAPLLPGEIRMVKVEVDTTGLEGFIKGAARLGTDDPSQPSYILRYDMMVRPEVTVDSGNKSLGEVAPHESPEIQFRFTREGGDPLKLVLAGKVQPYLEAELSHEGASANLRLRFRPGLLEPGTTAGLEVLKVATNAPRQPLFTLYMDWRIRTPVVPSPSRLVFGDLNTTLQVLELTARDGKPFRILKAEVQGHGFELLDSPGPEAVRHVLRIRRTGTTPEAMLVLTFGAQDTPMKVPLRFLDPQARPARVEIPPPAPAEDHHR